MPKLSDRTALVTGATSGIGRAIAVALAAEGARVAVHGRDPERGAAVVDAIRAAGGRADFLAADLGAGPDAVRGLAADTLTLFDGHVDVLVNNAGIFPSGPTVEIADATFDAVVAVNVRAPLVLVQALVPGMLARGSGTIVNVGSWVATVGLAHGSLYPASKATIEQLSRGWAAEFGPGGVRVNAIAPGVVATESAPASTRAIRDAMTAGTPAGRPGTPEEIAAAAVFLAGDAAAFVHGATLLVDGGALSTLARPV